MNLALALSLPFPPPGSSVAGADSPVFLAPPVLLSSPVSPLPPDLLRLALAPVFLLPPPIFLPPSVPLPSALLFPFFLPLRVLLPPVLPLPPALLQPFVLALSPPFVLCHSLLTIAILLPSPLFQGKLDVFCYHWKMIMRFNVLSAR